MVELDEYETLMALAGLAILGTTIGLRLLNRLNLPKFFVYFPVGLVAGPYVFGLAPADPLDAMEVLERVAEFAVIVSLVVAGMKIGRPFTWRGWRSTVRLILFVMPLTIFAIAATGHLLLGLALGPAILLGAILAPTDPVLAGAVQLEAPADDDEMRFGLTSEAGLNDGFAFPFVYLGLYLTLRADEWPGLGAYWALKDLLYAVAAGIAGGWVVGQMGGRFFLERAHADAISQQRRELIPLALLFFAYGTVEMLGGYGFLAAFVAGLGFRRAIDQEQDRLARFAEFTESIEAIAEAAAIIALGALFRGRHILDLGWGGVAFALVAIFLLRPLIVWLSTARSGFSTGTRAYWSWFGIRGIGSLYYLAYAITFGLPDRLAVQLFAATTLLVLLSNVLHGVTTYPMVRRLAGRGWLVHP